MATNQHNRFNSGGHPYCGTTPGRKGQGVVGDPAPWQLITWMWRKSGILLERLRVLIRYQFYKTTAMAPSRLQPGWPTAWRLSVIAFLAFIAMKRDVSVRVGEERGITRFATVESGSLLPLAEPGVKVVANSEPVDFFAADDDDDAETRDVKAYIRRFRKVAQVEMEKYGIPASVKMAQALVESRAGRSALSRKNNNHFGVKCFSKVCRKGHCSNFDDDTHKDFFRKYDTAWESWRAHSRFIVENKYSDLLQYGNDYRKWAAGLKRYGYATARNYDRKLIQTIEKYRLYELDN